MNNSVEELWEEQKRTRKKIFHWILLISSFLFCLISGLYFWITQPLLFLSSRNTAQISASPEALQAHVKKLSQDFYPRDSNSINNLNNCADYIKKEFGKTNGKVSEQPFQVNGKLYRNIIVDFGQNTAEKIIIGAHYDAAGEKPAADDNASGVAGLIELAGMLDGKSFSQSVELIAFTLEEPPYFATEQMGSYIHAKSLRDTGQKVNLMISLEMIGYFSDEPNSQKFPVSFMSLFYPNRGNYIAVIGNFTNGLTARKMKSAMSISAGLPVYSANAPTFVNGVDFSDHRNYWKFGFDAVMITDTAFYRNFNYHTAEDTAEKLDYNRMARVVEGIYQIVIETAE